MCSEDFKKSLWYKSRHMFIEAPEEGGATCRSKGPHSSPSSREIGSACAVLESTEFAWLHGLERLAVVVCQLLPVNLLVPWCHWPDDEMLSPWSAARVPVFLTCFVVRIRTLRTSSRMPERMFGLVVHVSKTLSLGCWLETACVLITCCDLE